MDADRKNQRQQYPANVSGVRSVRTIARAPCPSLPAGRQSRRERFELGIVEARMPRLCSRLPRCRADKCDSWRHFLPLERELRGVNQKSESFKSLRGLPFPLLKAGKAEGVPRPRRRFAIAAPSGPPLPGPLHIRWPKLRTRLPGKHGQGVLVNLLQCPQHRHGRALRVRRA